MSVEDSLSEHRWIPLVSVRLESLARHLFRVEGLKRRYSAELVKFLLG